VLRSFAEGALLGERFGTGPMRVLALHGWARTHRDFSAVFAPDGAEPLDGLAVDLPGFGATAAPTAPWGSPEYAAAVARVLPEMATPVVVLGHSFGGRVAVHLAAHHPEVVGGLVLSGVPLLRPAGARPSIPLAFRTARFLHRFGVVSERRMEALRQRYGSRDYAAAQGVMRQVFVKVVNEDYAEALAAIQCPVTFVWGEDDQTAPIELARRVAARLPAARFVALPGAGHLTPLSAPAALRHALAECLAASGPGS
jgi:pimeloyl-ACP methyl ester carboxylesterase